MADTNNETFESSEATELLSREGGYHLYENLSPTPEQVAVAAFESFVNGEECQVSVRDGMVACLADALVTWVTRGNATDVCPSFEHYLQVTIHIIAIWSGEPGWLYNGDQVSRNDFATLFRPDSGTQVWNHPAFQRNVYQYAQQRRALQRST